jgi:hypothetical protein
MYFVQTSAVIGYSGISIWHEKKPGVLEGRNCKSVVLVKLGFTTTEYVTEAKK